MTIVRGLTRGDFEQGTPGTGMGRTPAWTTDRLSVNNPKILNYGF